MIAFRGLRVGSVAPAMSGPRQAALEPSGGREKRPCGRPCRLFGRRRAARVMDRHHGGPRSSPKNPQGRQMYHPPMKVSTGVLIRPGPPPVRFNSVHELLMRFDPKRAFMWLRFVG